MRWCWIICVGLLVLGCDRPPKRGVQGLLKTAGLAPLPLSATNVSHHLWKGIFTAEECARFQLSPADLRAFISNSPPLITAKPQLYDSTRHYKVMPTNGIIDDTHGYFMRHPEWPAWFDPALQGRGRVYEYWPHWHVVLDEEKNIVWLRWSD
jgi:hypothetical protein